MYLATLTLSLLLAACGGGGSDATVAAEFSVNGVKGTISGQNVTLDLSSLGNCAVNINNMVVTVNASGYTISPDPTAARDYSAPVDFTITAPDGTKVVYKVTVTGAACLGTTPAPAPAPATVACSAAPINPAESYSLVFKGCSAANVAEYYDKTECVRQNSSGLIWQGQTAVGSGTIRDKNQYKTNFDSTEGTQDYNGGSPIPATNGQITDLSNSIGFRNTVNGAILCGSNSWRLPTKEELQGLIKSAESPKIDNIWFPNARDGRYWTSSTYATDTNYTYYVDFGSGITSFDVRGNNVLGTIVGRGNVRLVLDRLGIDR